MEVRLVGQCVSGTVVSPLSGHCSTVIAIIYTYNRGENHCSTETYLLILCYRYNNL